MLLSIRFGIAAIVVCLGIFSSGCSSAPPSVEGKVTFDGAPLEKGSITFIPSDGESQTAGGEIAAGKYTVPVPAGKFKVEITAGKVIGKKKAYDTPDSPLIDQIEQYIPAKYNSDSTLTIDVNAGKNTHDFELTSK